MKLRINHGAGNTPEKKENKRLDTPAVTLNKVRSLIEDDKEHSTTDIAHRLNGFAKGDTRPTLPMFPRATGSGSWSAADVDSLLDRQDMGGLRDQLATNKPVEETATGLGGISPLDFRQSLANDLAALLRVQNKDLTDRFNEVTSTVLDQVRSDLEGLARLQAGTTDLPAIKAAVSDAINTRLRSFDGGNDVAETVLERVVADTADEVSAVFEKVMEQANMPAVKRVVEATSKNTVEVIKQLDKTTDDLFETLKAGLDESATTISMIVVERVDEKFAAFMTEVNEKVQAAVDEKVGEIISTAIDRSMSQIQNSHAVQAAKFEKTVQSLLDKAVGTRLDKIEKRLKNIEDEEAEWNGG